MTAQTPEFLIAELERLLAQDAATVASLQVALTEMAAARTALSSFQVLVRVGRTTHDRTRFAPSLEVARESAERAVEAEFFGCGRVVSVAPWYGPLPSYRAA